MDSLIDLIEDGQECECAMIGCAYDLVNAGIVVTVDEASDNTGAVLGREGVHLSHVQACH